MELLGGETVDLRLDRQLDELVVQLRSSVPSHDNIQQDDAIAKLTEEVYLCWEKVYDGGEAERVVSTIAKSKPELLQVLHDFMEAVLTGIVGQAYSADLTDKLFAYKVVA